MFVTLRQATRLDIPGMHRVRLAVRENRLTSSIISEEHYVPAIEATGRGWVIVIDDSVVAFAVGNKNTGNIWALFVDPDHEGFGYGRRLHDAMVDWLFQNKISRLNLSTAFGTRAEKFYEKAGWAQTGQRENGEVYFELFNPTKT